MAQGIRSNTFLVPWGYRYPCRADRWEPLSPLHHLKSELLLVSLSENSEVCPHFSQVLGETGQANS